MFGVSPAVAHTHGVAGRADLASSRELQGLLQQSLSSRALGRLIAKREGDELALCRVLNGARVAPGDRNRARRHLEQRDADGVDIRAGVDPLADALRCERAAPSARAACAARQERCARTLQLSGHVDAPAPLATTTGGLQITYEPSLMGGVGIALAVMLVMYMYAMELAMFNPEPP